jgi:hypothetical protein
VTKHLVLVTLAVLLLTGCPGKKKAIRASSPPPAPSAVAPSAAPLAGEITEETYPVICGCLVDGIKHCGEYAVIEGKHVEITDHALGKMPFCGKGRELKAKLSGTFAEGKLKSSAVEVLK